MGKRNGNTEATAEGQTAKGKAVVITVPAARRAEYERQAGLIPLSRWVKGMVEAALDANLTPKAF